MGTSGTITGFSDYWQNMHKLAIKITTLQHLRDYYLLWTFLDCNWYQFRFIKLRAFCWRNPHCPLWHNIMNHGNNSFMVISQSLCLKCEAQSGSLSALMSQGNALPRVPECVTSSQSVKATVPTDCGDLQVQGCNWPSLGQELLFSVHLEMKISNLTDCFLAEATEKSCPGSSNTSVWMCVWHIVL